MTILTLPLRVAVGAARIGLGVAERLIEALLPSSGAEAPAPPAPAPVQAEPVAEPRERVEPTEPVRPRRRSESRPPAAPPRPEHVSEEPVVVAEVADPGAEEAPGAVLSVEEPWDGYRRMKADEVIARVAEATREELAVVQLYEGTHRRRKTVLAAAERRLKLLSPPGRE